MTQSKLKGKIRLGWHLYQDDIPCDIPTSGNLNYHTAILAQSGSGKSYFLGRLLEELLLTTQAKMLIFDPNGDFTYFNEVPSINQKPWDKANQQYFGYCEKRGLNKVILRDIRENFIQYWEQLRFRFTTNAEIKDSEITYKFKTTLHFSELDVDNQLATLGLSESDNPNEVLLYKDLIENYIFSKGNNLNTKYSLVELYEFLESSKLGATFPGDSPWRKPAIRQFSKIIVTTKLDELSKSGIWEIDHNGEDVIDNLAFYNDRWDCTVVDLVSIIKSVEKKIIVNACLDKIWIEAYRGWQNAVLQQSINPKFKDQRVPIFIVFDEAHSFIPDQSTDHWSRLIIEKVQRIVAEGRKYGVFLILATQRPSKVPTSILSECDNICLLRLNSILERTQVNQLWGIPKEDLEQVTHFGKGECLLFGRWVPSNYVIHSAPRRTREGGGDIPNWTIPRIL